MSKLLLIFFFILKESWCVNVYSCGDIIEGQKQFLVQSDERLQNYGLNQRCEITMKAECDNFFNFQFLVFDLEDSVGCVKDRLEVFGQDAICGKKSGVKIYKSQGGELKIRFVTDDLNSEKGFQILVTKQPCNTSLSTTTETLQNCCGDEYRLHRFFLASPNFPYPSQRSDCIFKIFRSNPNICRLRLHFRYFQTDCQDSYIELDGRRICGCKTNLKLISRFDPSKNNPKIIRYVPGGNKDYFKGFILEVIQDECPDKYIPESRLQTSQPQLFYYNDQLNKLETNLEDAKMVSAEVSSNSTLRERRAAPVFHYYFYGEPMEEGINEVAVPLKEPLKEAESTDYFELEDPLPDIGEDVCRNWGVYEFKQISEEVLWKQMRRCGGQIGGVGGGGEEDNCCVIKGDGGYLSTPGYPYYYGRNLDLCYRFPKANGCGYKIFMVDFAVEPSFQCQKDAFILYNQRYCGYSLMRSQFIMDLSQKPHEDIHFKTDNTYCGRGFKLYFQRLPCSMSTMTPPTGYNCGGEISGRQRFELAIPRTGYDCTYDIRKFDRDVCKMHLFFNSDLDCRVEYLLIQNKQYCGYLQNKNVTVDFVQTDVIRVYYHLETMRPVMSSPVLLRGQQINNDCYDEPPAQRIFTQKTTS